MSSRSPQATYGLATQLRTPPQNSDGFSSPTLSVGSPPKKMTPAMRDDLRSSPNLGGAQWSSRAQGQTAPIKVHRKPAHGGAAGSHDTFGYPAKKVAPVVLDTLTIEEEHAPPPPTGRRPSVPSAHVRTKSIPTQHNNHAQPMHSRSASQSAPHRPPRPSTPPLPHSHHGAPPPLPASASDLQSKYGLNSSGGGSRDRDEGYAKPDISFLPMRPLDLGIKFDPVYTTYTGTKSTPDVRHTSSKRDDDEDSNFEASVTVAQRGQRSNSFRKASLGPLLTTGPGGAYWVPPLPTERKLSTASVSSSKSNRSSLHEGGLSVPRLRTRSISPDGRQIGQGLRASYSSASGTSVPTFVMGRRSSSVYIPNPSSAPPLPAPVSMAAPVSPNSQAQRLPLGLLSLARRTAHISSTPGYAWRLNLLEKLETLTGTFLAISEAEAILTIGNGPEKSRAKRNAESRKSQIGMPVNSAKPKSKGGVVKQPEPKGFFAKMKRSLTNGDKPHSHDHSGAPGLPKGPAARVVFGAPLAAVAEYGFVTSMIAGQRHDLPGVCFSAVEEIYRRGQGMKVPGLMHLAGEATRVAALVKIFDSAPDYGEHHDLSIESIHNVTSLLKKYLRDLPEPIMDQRLWRLYLSACVDASIPLKSRVACAQVVLRLLPTPNFSLLVYLVAFLSQMPLFPENRLTLESVSAIFGPAAMSPRPPANAAHHNPSKLSKFAGSMVITGPTDTVEATGANAKKAQDGLLWLLTHWSAVADGLLEADFDINLDDVLERSPDGPPIASPDERVFAQIKAMVQPPSASSTIEIQSKPAFDRSQSSPASPKASAARRSPRHPAQDEELLRSPRSPGSPSRKSSPAMSHQGSIGSMGSPGSPGSLASPVVIGRAQVSPAGSLYQHPSPIPSHHGMIISNSSNGTTLRPTAPQNGGFLSPSMSVKSAQNSPQPLQHQRIAATRQEAAEYTPQASPSVYSPNSVASPASEKDDPLSEAPVAEVEPPVTVAATTSGPTDSDSRSSASSFSSHLVRTPSLPKERSNAPLLREHSQKHSMPHGADKGVGFAPRAIPEDEFGPLGGVPSVRSSAEGVPNSSVLDDMLNFDTDAATLYNFPAPPSHPPARSLPPTPSRTPTPAAVAPTPVEKIVGAPFTAPLVIDSPNPESIMPLVRSNGEQLREAQGLIERQREEIQTLWSQLTDLESERMLEKADREQFNREMEHLRTQHRMDIEEINEARQAEMSQIKAEHAASGAGAARDGEAVAEAEAQVAHWQEQHAHSKAELEEVQRELAQMKEQAEKDREAAQQQIASLSSQLDGIRSLLGGRI